MKGIRILKHILIVVVSLSLLLGLPFVSSDYFKNQLLGQTDGISSASILIDQPSGEFVILINKDFHPNEEYLQQWIDYFSGGEEYPFFEDLSCLVSLTDSSALTMAQSFQSRLPENQMTIQEENSTLLCSMADAACFDVLIMSKEYAQAYHLETAYGDRIAIIEIKGGAI